ncbi:unnamed protein product [Sphagnum balticum]
MRKLTLILETVLSKVRDVVSEVVPILVRVIAILRPFWKLRLIMDARTFGVLLNVMEYATVMDEVVPERVEVKLTECLARYLDPISLVDMHRIERQIVG